MDTLLFFATILYCTIFLSHGLVLQRPLEDVFNFYEIDAVKKIDESSAIDNLKNSEDSSYAAYVLLVPKEGRNIEILLDKSKEYNKYVLIKSKLKLVDLDAYSVTHHHDSNEHIVKWLHLYCEMHPDCDKSKLNEELRKVRPYLK